MAARQTARNHQGGLTICKKSVASVAEDQYNHPQSFTIPRESIKLLLLGQSESETSVNCLEITSE